MDQMAVQNEKISRPKNIAQMNASVLMGPLYQKKGSTNVKSRHQTSTSQAYISFWIKKRWQWKNCEEPRRTMKNMRKT